MFFVYYSSKVISILTCLVASVPSLIFLSIAFSCKSNLLFTTLTTASDTVFTILAKALLISFISFWVEEERSFNDFVVYCDKSSKD